MFDLIFYYCYNNGITSATHLNGKLDMFYSIAHDRCEIASLPILLDCRAKPNMFDTAMLAGALPLYYDM